MSQSESQRPNCPDRMYLRKPPSEPRWPELHSLLRDNQHPFRSTRATDISHSLSQARDVAQWYDDEISRLNAYVFSLQNRRADAKAHAKQYESLLSPVRKMPPELLRCIFGHFCDRSVISDTITIPAVVLGSVCSHWRTLATSFPECWANITLDTRSPVFVASRARIAMRFILERSGSVPMVVSIFDQYESLVDGSALGLLLTTSNRWTELTLVTGDGMERFSCLKGKLPALEHLDLAVQGTQPCTLFDGTPALRSLCVGGRLNELLIDQTRIRRIHFNCNTFLTPGFDLRWPNLVEISSSRSLRMEENVRVPIKIVSIVCGPRLKEVETFFTHATAPSLSSIFLLSTHGMTSPFPVYDFSSFIARSGCRLSTISLQDAISSPEETGAIMQLLPAVSDFTYIQEKTGFDLGQLILHMTARSSLASGVLLPKLAKLQLTLKSLSNQYAFVEMVKSRWLPYATKASGIQCLKVLRLKLLNPLQELDGETFSPLRDISRAGMSVVLLDQPKGVMW